MKYKWVYKSLKFLKNHIGDILTIAGIIGTAASVVATADATMEATKEVYEEALRDDENRSWPDPPYGDVHFANIDILKKKWKKFIIPALVTGGTITVEILAHSHYSNVIIGLAAGLEMASRKKAEYEAASETLYGEHAAHDIHMEASKQVLMDKVEAGDISVPDHEGMVHVFEPVSEQDFWVKSEDDIKYMAAYMANEKLAEEWELPFGEWLDILASVAQHPNELERLAGDNTYGWYAMEDVWREWWDFNYNGKVWLEVDLEPIQVDGLGEVLCIVYNTGPDTPSMGLDGYEK